MGATAMTDLASMLEALRAQRSKLDAAIAALEALSDDGKARPSLPSDTHQADGGATAGARATRRPKPAQHPTGRTNGAGGTRGPSRSACWP